MTGDIEEIICGECSDDMGEVLDEWADALESMSDTQRVRCALCGA
jgi:hypothetical protein